MKHRIVGKWLTIFCAGFICGCSATFIPSRAKTVAPAYLASIAQCDPTNHLCYMGSDERFHYFFRSQLFGGGSYKISISEFTPKQKFLLNRGEPYIPLREDFAAP